MHICRGALSEFTQIARIGHQPADLNVIEYGIYRRQAAPIDEIDNQLIVGSQVSPIAHCNCIRQVVRGFREYALILGRRRLAEQHGDQRDVQLSALSEERWGIPIPIGTQVQVGDPGDGRDRFLQDLQALSKDLVPLVDGDAGEVAAWAGEARHQSGPHKIAASNQNDRYCVVRGADRLCDFSADRHDHIGLSIDDRASEVGKPSGRPSPEYRSTDRFCPSTSPNRRSSAKNA